MAERLDIVIMGATGFTGLNCIPYIHKLSKSDGHNYSWGVAGRSETKLKEVLKQMETRCEADFSNIPIIICDIEDDESLLTMAQKAKLVINCVGPYILYGERVVDACLEAGTHHIDVSGEPNYMEQMQLKKNKIAREKGVYIISACGLDSIPSDLGIIYLDQKFNGVINSVVTYLQFFQEGKSSGPLINYGTWASLVHNISRAKELRRIRKELFPEKLPSFKPKLKRQMWPHKSDFLDGWILPFLGADRSVISRTQRYLYEVENKRPIQIDTLCVFESIFHVIFLLFGGIMWLMLSKFEFGKNLLLDYPKVFTFGIFSKEQPSQETVENSSFQITFEAEGWTEKLADKNDQYSKPCDKKMVTRVKGKNPGYGSTCICLVAAAVTVLNEKDQLPGNGKGGVYSPGAAFGKTKLIKLLNDNEVTFEIVSESN